MGLLNLWKVNMTDWCLFFFLSIVEMPSEAATGTDYMAVQGNSDTDSTLSDAEARPANRKTRKRVSAVPIAIICPEKRAIKKPKRYTDD